MDRIGILGFIVTLISVISVSVVFTILFLNDFRNSKNEIEQGRLDIEFIDKQIDLEKKARADRINVGLVVGKTLSIVFSTIVLAFFVFAVINRINDNKIIIGNKTHLVIATGSMSEKHENNEYLVTYNLNNQFAANSIIEIENIREDQLYIYDVVAFKNFEGQTIVHRIVDISYEGGVVHYVMRGDANNANDTFMPVFDDIIGRYNSNYVPSIGILILFMQSNSGITTVLAVFYCLGLFATLHEKIERMKRDRTSLLLSIIDYDIEDHDSSFEHDFVENIYYKGFVYRFKYNDFVGKETIGEEDRFKSDAETKMIKVITNKDGETKIETNVINPKKEL